MSNFRLFLCGDVMLGRGIDQILSHPSKPQLYEAYVHDAREYILLAQEQNGTIHYPVAMNYIWGDALTIWKKQKPDLKIINLETTITQNESYLPYKGIHYRMHPFNIEVLISGGIDCCTLANNHILDWDYRGLSETLSTLKNIKIKASGAGENITEAMQPAIFKFGSNHRALVFAVGLSSSGIPSSWSATAKRPGIYYLPDLSRHTLLSIHDNIKQYKQSHDLVIFSIHWGSNWGYEISESTRSFAHELIDIAKVDVVFGHSSHHLRPIEIYHDKPIFYGCGDFINDYEGISGYEEYRGDLALMYFLDFDNASLTFNKMTLIPLQIKKFSLHYANKEDSQWIMQTLNKCSKVSGQLVHEDFYKIIIPLH